MNRNRRIARHIGLLALRGYQAFRTGKPSPCRFVPSCSSYAEEAITRYGLLHGSWLTMRRLSRCRPFGRYGFDPVPDRGI